MLAAAPQTLIGLLCSWTWALSGAEQLGRLTSRGLSGGVEVIEELVRLAGCRRHRRLGNDCHRLPRLSHRARGATTHAIDGDLLHSRPRASPGRDNFRTTGGIARRLGLASMARLTRKLTVAEAAKVVFDSHIFRFARRLHESWSASPRGVASWHRSRHRVFRRAGTALRAESVCARARAPSGNAFGTRSCHRSWRSRHGAVVARPPKLDRQRLRLLLVRGAGRSGDLRTLRIPTSTLRAQLERHTSPSHRRILDNVFSRVQPRQFWAIGFESSD